MASRIRGSWWVVGVVGWSGVLTGCEASRTTDEPVHEDPTNTSPALGSADHHLHIRSAEAAAHQDVLSVEIGERSADAPPSEAFTAADAIAALDSAGIDGGLVLSNAYMYGMPDAPAANERALVRAENEYVAAQVAEHSTRLRALCSFNPLAGYAIEEVETCGQDGRITGLKLHLANSDLSLRDDAHVEALAGVFEEANRHGLAILIHMRTRESDYGRADVTAFVDRVLSRAPDVPVQIAHMAGWGGYDDATDAALGEFVRAFAEGRINTEVTFGLGATVFQPGAAGADTALMRRTEEANIRLAARIQELGPERVVYATDWPAWPPVADPAEGVFRNVSLVRTTLPLDAPTLDRILSNVSSFFTTRVP